MPIITGGDSDFGRLVVEEFKRRAQRVVELGQASGGTEPDEATAGEEETGGDPTGREHVPKS